jgi:hypothetical protein
MVVDHAIDGAPANQSSIDTLFPSEVVILQV